MVGGSVVHTLPQWSSELHSARPVWGVGLGEKYPERACETCMGHGGAGALKKEYRNQKFGIGENFEFLPQNLALIKQDAMMLLRV